MGSETVLSPLSAVGHWEVFEGTPARVFSEPAGEPELGTQRGSVALLQYLRGSSLGFLSLSL